MGVDKARLASGGVPMAVHMMETVQAVCERARLVRREASDGLPWIDRSERPLLVLREPAHEGTHPLWGVGAALAEAEGPLALVVPCDLPNLPASALEQLVRCGPSVATDGDTVHPLVAVLPTEWSDRAYALARQGAPARALVEGLQQVRLDAVWLRDVNTPALRRAEVAVWRRCLEGLSQSRRLAAQRGERSRQRARGMLSLELEAHSDQQE
jgi:molybdopterin-guanine dinucleotide biosynthesis protein A